jgi:gliding motility-associated lipoprotein GldH
VFFIFWVFLSIVSCGPKVIYDQTISTKNPWTYDQKLTYEFEVVDTTKAYDMTINILHAADFVYENLYLNATTVFPNGKATTSPVSLQLSDDKDDWLGDCSGDQCKVSIEMASGTYFAQQGLHRLILEQHSRRDSLSGIKAIEVVVVCTQAK